MSNVSNLVSQFLSGKPIESSGPSSSASSEESVRADASMSDAQEDYGTDAKSNDSSNEDLLPGNEDALADSQNPADAKANSKSGTPNKEVITVSDENGRRKVEIDYSDKEAIKKAFQFQHGARKWQVERDRALESHKTLTAELTQIKEDWAKMDAAFQEGPEKLLELLKPGALQEMLDKQSKHQEFLKHASPEEVKAFEAEDRAARIERELEKERKANEKFRKDINEKNDAAEEKELASRLNPTFDKYRFAGTLGDAQDEHLFDKMLWNSVTDRLVEYEDAKVPLTQELINKEFKEQSNVIRKRINAQADKKAGKVVEQKKREATENVQAKVMSGYKTGGAANEARDLIKKGDLTSLLKGWGKYGTLFNK